MYTSWWLSVAQQQGKDIVSTIVAGLCDETQVWGICASIGISSSLLIPIWSWQWVCKSSRSFIVLPFLVRTICHLDLTSHLLDFILSVSYPNQVSEMDLLNAVASCADLLIYLMTSPY